MTTLSRDRNRPTHNDTYVMWLVSGTILLGKRSLTQKVICPSDQCSNLIALFGPVLEPAIATH